MPDINALRREHVKFKSKADNILAQIKAHEEKHGEKLRLSQIDIIPGDHKVIVRTINHEQLEIAKSEVSRLKRFVDIMAERYGNSG